MTMPQRGRLITLEGGEGVGKSTHARHLAECLPALIATEVRLTREPGGSPGAEEIRRLLVEGETARWTPLTEALLHSAARSDHIARFIEPALSRGDWVISDRYTDSTIAYQGYGHGLDIRGLHTLTDLVTEGLKPDLTLILDLEAETGLSRAGRRTTTDSAAENRYERMDRAFHERIRSGFHAIAAREPDRCIIIDASAPIEAVSREIEQAIIDRFGLNRD